MYSIMRLSQITKRFFYSLKFSSKSFRSATSPSSASYSPKIPNGHLSWGPKEFLIKKIFTSKSLNNFGALFLKICIFFSLRSISAILITLESLFVIIIKQSSFKNVSAISGTH